MLHSTLLGPDMAVYAEPGSVQDFFSWLKGVISLHCRQNAALDVGCTN